jgi:hypothetical protein
VKRRASNSRVRAIVEVIGSASLAAGVALACTCAWIVRELLVHGRALQIDAKDSTRSTGRMKQPLTVICVVAPIFALFSLPGGRCVTSRRSNAT